MEDIFETIGDYLEKYNALALKTPKNTILHFKSRDEMYLYVFKEIRKYCKRGYIEIALLVKHLTQFDDETCEEIAGIIRKQNSKMVNDPLFVDWQNVGYEKEKLIAIIKGMHYLTETEYDWSAGEYAWVLFRKFNKEYNELCQEEET